MKQVPIVCWQCGKKTEYTKIENVYGGRLVLCDKCKIDNLIKEMKK